MKFASLAFIFTFCLNVTLINGQSSDGQFACAFGGALRAKRSIIPQFLVPTSVSAKKVKFFMYRKVQSDHDEYMRPVNLINGNTVLLQAADFDPKALTKIFIHGYKSDFNRSSPNLIRKGFFKNQDFNVIIVDWSEAQHNGLLGSLYPYDSVLNKIDAVGAHVANMLLFLEGQGLDLSTTTVVGHSLGAHVAGIAGHKVDGRIGRIVGLDPASPLVSERPLENRLSKDDAVQVEIVHSEIDQCGLKNQMGHYDFYPNSGHRQPGCNGKNQCSHSRSYHFFAESLDPHSIGFYGRLCKDWEAMQEGNCHGEELLMGGLNTKTATEGMYYLKTNSQSPFARGHA